MLKKKMIPLNKLFLICCFLPSLGIPSHLSVNPVEELLSRHLHVSGGENVLMNIKSISRYGQISFYVENSPKETFCYHTDIIYPKKLREQIKGKQIEYDRGTDGTSFWLWTGSQYDFTEDKALINYMQGTAERANRDLIWIKKESTNFELMSKLPSWAPNNSQCIQMIKSERSIKRAYCFDISTGLLNALGSAEEYRLESDWRKVGSIQLPFHIAHYRNGAMIYELQLDYAKLNHFISNDQFLKPSSPHLDC